MENFDQYKSKLPFPQRPSKPVFKHNATAKDARDYADRLDHYEKVDYPVYINAINTYRKDEARLYDKFKADLFDDLGITGHPKADKLYMIAYSRGHSAGFQEVYNEALELVDLIK